ncbi:ParA family protein [Streptomyces brevispora]|uniref:ParA family protein n=1 Tax=Streptomyces brevispora TaxID=887462 RepID=UPI00371C415C
MTTPTSALAAADRLRYGPLPFAEPATTRIIVMCNQKGGVGKTTTTINLAGGLASFGQRVLIVDGDPSGNATDAYKIEMLDEDEGDTQVTCLLGGKDPHALVAKPFPLIHVLPASMDMQFLPARLRERGNAYHAHRKMLAHFQGEYDYILLDTRPAIDTDTDSMTAAADAAITMVDVDRWAMKAVSMQLAQHEMIMAELERSDFTELGLVISTAKASAGHFDAAVLKNLRNHPKLVNLGEVPYRGADLKEARASGQPVQMYRPRSDTAGFFRDIAVKSGMVAAAA